MSEFLAEAKVLILPDTKGFATLLRSQLEAAVAKAGPVVVPITAAPIAGGVTASASALATASDAAAASTLGLASASDVANSSLGREAVLLDAVTISEQQAAAAAEKAGAAFTLSAAQLGNLSKAASFAGAATAELATAQEAAALTGTELAAARATLRVSSSAVAIAEEGLAAALKASNIALIDAASAELNLAAAHEVNARAAVKDAIAHGRDAAVTAESAAAHAQATRGIVAEALALGGLRGATLAASAPFLIGATAAIVFSKSIKNASDATEEFNKTSVVFGQNAEAVQKFAETSARSFGIASTEALQAAGVFGNLFRSVGLAAPASADLSVQLVKLAADLASFNNASPERTLEALRAGLVGQARPLRIFGVFLSQARAQQEALIETGKKNVKELTNAELVQARFNIILRDTTLAQGDFARTSEQTANQSRILKAQVSDLSDQLGHVLLPAVNTTVNILNDYVGALQAAVTGTKDFIAATGKIPGPTEDSKSKILDLEKSVTKLYFRTVVLGPVLTAALLAEKQFGDGAEVAAKKVSGFHFALGGLQAEIAAMKAVQKSVDFSNITSQLKALETERLKIQTGLASGGQQAQESNLRQQIALDKKAVAEAASGTKARRDAIEALKSDQEELARLIEEDGQKIQDAADAQKAAAEKAAQAQAEATQAFIDSFGKKSQGLQNQLSTAQLFGNASQQIEANKNIVAADKEEINAIQKRIRHLHLFGDALKAAKATIATLTQEIFNTRNAIAQLKADRKQAIVDARQQHLEAALSIAETTASTRDDAAAEKALIKFDQVQIRRILAIKRRRRLTLEEAAQLDAYRVDLAQRNQALKDLKGEADNTNKKMQELTFAFLQTQQGFAANLLGNLIPGFATSGLVGGSPAASGAAAGDPFAFTPNAAEINTGVGGSAAVAAGKGATVRPVQVDTTNSLLRQILAALRSRPGHPEAAHQRQTATASYYGPDHGF